MAETTTIAGKDAVELQAELIARTFPPLPTDADDDHRTFAKTWYSVGVEHGLAAARSRNLIGAQPRINLDDEEAERIVRIAMALAVAKSKNPPHLFPWTDCAREVVAAMRAENLIGAKAGHCPECVGTGDVGDGSLRGCPLCDGAKADEAKRARAAALREAAAQA